MLNEDLLNLHWREPLWLFICLLPITISLIKRLLQKNTLDSYADRALQPWVVLRVQRRLRQRFFSSNTAYGLAWILFAVSAAGPRLPLEIHGEQQSYERDIYLVVDVSQSMLATDVLPNRILRAKLEILELLERLQNQRAGIIVYTARPHLYVPLTSDHNALKHYLEKLDSLILPTQGSQPGAALELALQELNDSQTNGSIVFITDGDYENINIRQHQQLENVVRQIKENLVSFAILGVGSVEGDAVPVASGGWLEHQGRPVITRMDDNKLISIAELGGGFYSAALDGSDDWTQLFDKGFAMQTHFLELDEEKQTIVWREFYSWTLAPAIILFFIALTPYKVSRKNSFVVTFAPIILSISLSMANSNFAVAKESTDMRHAYDLFQKKNYSAAAQNFQRNPGFNARFGEGTSRYKLEDYSGAIQQFVQAILTADDTNDRAKALYNLGNSYYQLGNYAAAVQVFEDVLRYHSQHKAAQHNLELSRKLKALVDRRAMQSAFAQQAGSGPRQALPEQSIQINETTTIILDQSENQALPDLLDPLPMDSELETLVQRGLQYVRVAAVSDTSSTVTITWQQDISQARTQMENLLDDQIILWKRIFEIEENYPAPLVKPKEIKGITPW